MEQIRRDGDVYYYGEHVCRSADEVYQRYRNDYHVQLGRNVHLRLGRLGRRKERIHGHGTVFLPETMVHLRDEFGGYGKVPCRILGIVGTSYCRIFGIWDAPEFPEDRYERWLDWALSRGSGVLRLVGLRNKTGRTKTKGRKRFR